MCIYICIVLSCSFHHGLGGLEGHILGMAFGMALAAAQSRLRNEYMLCAQLKRSYAQTSFSMRFEHYSCTVSVCTKKGYGMYLLTLLLLVCRRFCASPSLYTILALYQLKPY